MNKKATAHEFEPTGICLPFPLPIAQAKKDKKKCCKKHKKGKRCKNCPER